jgi:hypothetical protein
LLTPYVLVFPVVSYLLTFPPISYMHSSSPPFVLHDLLISSSQKENVFCEIYNTGLILNRWTPYVFCILLHVRPILGNVLVNKFPQRQILCKQSVASLRNNRRGCVFRVRGDVSQRWVVVTWYVFTISPFPGYRIKAVTS